MQILAVDDEQPALEALTAAIEEAAPGAVLHACRDAAGAEAILAQTPCEVAFLDIELRGTSGIVLAQRLKVLYPALTIIFATGYSSYSMDAFALHASGYLLKPITPDQIRRELKDLRCPVVPTGEKRVRLQTFGKFEVFVDGAPLRFKYDKTRELLAYLVDCGGTLCSSGELMSVLWTDDDHASYLRNLRKDLLDTLHGLGCADILCNQRGKLGLVPEKVSCDYYDWRKGLPYALNAYRGEYMSQYSWGEFAHATLDNFHT